VIAGDRPAADRPLGGRPERWHPVLAVLKIAKVTFWFIWLTPFVFGWVASDGGSARHLVWFWGTAAGVCLVDAACNLHNELVDREEDAVNQPNRTRLLASVPEWALWALVAFGYAYALLGIVTLSMVVGVATSALILATALVALLYNAGPRLKRRPVLSELAIGWATLAAFAVGWSMHRPIADLPPVAWALAYFVTVTACLKDLPDARGDEQVGVRRLVTVPRPALRRAALAFIYLSPYAVTAALVGLDQLPARTLAVGALLPVALWLAILADRGGSLTATIAAYQLGFLYIHVFSLTLFLLYVYDRAALLPAAILLVGRLAALVLGLDPRLVEPDFSWSGSVRALRLRRAAGGQPAPTSSAMRNPMA
jgi:4-hydroxybenzoate polyprenyltransferase